MSRSPGSGAVSPRACAAITLTSPAARICSIDSLNLAATSRASAAPVRCSQAWLRSAKAGNGTSTRRAVRSLSARASRREAAASTIRSGLSSIARSRRPRSAGDEILEAVDAEQPPCSAAARRASASASGRSSSRAPSSTTGARAADARTAAAVRAAGHERQSRIGGQQQPEALGRLVTSGQIIRTDAAHGGSGAGVGEVDGAQEKRGQPVGDLHRAVGERRRRLAGQQADGALPWERRAGSKARQHLPARQGLVREQVRGQAGARQLAGDVVVQVGVEAAEAGVELRCRAEREDQAVDRLQPKPLGGERERRRRRTLPAIGCEREGLLVGDVEPAQRVVRVGAARDGGADGCPQAIVEKGEKSTEAALARLTCASRRPRPRPRARGHRPAARPSAARRATRRAAGPRGRAHG